MGHLLGTRWGVASVLVVVLAALIVVSYPWLDSISSQRVGETDLGRVGDEFQNEVEENPSVTPHRIWAFAADHDVRWGVVRAKDGLRLQGNVTAWDPDAVRRAVAEGAPTATTVSVEAGPRAGEVLATYATPVDATTLHPLEGGDATVVFVRFYD